MTKDEMGKIFELLTIYYGKKASVLQTPKGQAAWMLALERFPYEDVKTAVIDFAVQSKYFPAVADITAKLKQPTPIAAKAERKIHPLEMEAVRRLMGCKNEGSDVPSER